MYSLGRNWAYGSLTLIFPPGPIDNDPPNALCLAGWLNVDVGRPKAVLVLGSWANADEVVTSDGLGGRVNGPDVGAFGFG